MTPLIFDPPFAYLVAYRLAFVIAGTAILLLIASLNRRDSDIADWLHRKRFWLRMAVLPGALLAVPHLLDLGQPTYHRLYRH